MKYTEIVPTSKKYVPNIIIRFKGHYWGIRQPDSGLVIETQRLGLESVAINPTSVNPIRPNTTLNSYSFRLTDLKQSVTRLFDGVRNFFNGEAVEIYIGRVGVGMAFSEYMKLPITYVKEVSKDGNAYNFKTQDAKDRINRPAFDTTIKQEVDILSNTTEIDAVGVIDVNEWPSFGLFKINDEFISYTGIDVINNRFVGCIRGEKLSIPSPHLKGSDIYLVQEITDNPLNIFLKMIVSKGGGSIYDVLFDGAGIDHTLLDIEKIENLREEFFSGQIYSVLVYNQSNIMTFLEEEILYPNELRIISDNNAKISLTILNKKSFDDLQNVIGEDSQKTLPNYVVDDKDVVNHVILEYDYNEGTNVYQNAVEIRDQDSIDEFGKREAVIIKSKGIKQSLAGEQIANDIAQRFLNRFSYPKPTITTTTHMDKSLINIGDKVEFLSRLLPTEDGQLNFGESLEVVERGINWKTGDVRFKLMFTSFTGIRECYLAPSDKIINWSANNQIEVGAGRGSLYRVGWIMKLYDQDKNDHYYPQINTISGIIGDTIFFENDWENIYLTKPDGTFILNPSGNKIKLKDIRYTNTRIMFADYDEVQETQKAYCFISNNGGNFEDNRKTYQISFS